MSAGPGREQQDRGQVSLLSGVSKRNLTNTRSVLQSLLCVDFGASIFPIL